ncbi:glycosyltransferase [Subtercola vilae]|uniref:glycosyltransferase n=1 Tax=Subtercola vilae TaxID=2056433 RepID=UPI0013762A8C|nr:glycosyltransferase [Subtercola vilae]
MITSGRPRIIYFAIPSLDYPRNSRIRAYLAETGADVVIPDLGIDHQGWKGTIRRFFSLVKESRGASVIVLAEFGTKYALPAKILARFRGARLIVDGFVGMYETHIGDWADHSPSSLKARLYRLIDWVAFRASDLYLIDTEVRAEAIRSHYSLSRLVMSLPVGAPSWAVPAPLRDPAAGKLRLLYYGNYIPLHGTDTIIEALTDPRVREAVSVTFIGDGKLRARAEQLVVERGLSGIVTFVDAVPSFELANAIARHHVVLGVFGTSDKAGSVIANKVWQGLASGRMVITQQSKALLEIAQYCGPQLRTTAPGNPVALADELADLVGQLDPGTDWVFSGAAQALETYVEEKYSSLRLQLATWQT